MTKDDFFSEKEDERHFYGLDFMLTLDKMKSKPEHFESYPSCSYNVLHAWFCVWVVLTQ